MDIEQLRRINSLSHELKRHHFADSSTDAYKQAEEIVQFAPRTAPASHDETPVAIHKPVEPIVEQKFALELERVKKELEQENDTLRNAVNQLIIEINTFREELDRVKKVQPPQPKEKQAPLKTQAKEAHPRQGDFQPGDVDIQKMFYFGNK